MDEPVFCPRCRAGRYTPYTSVEGRRPTKEQLEAAPFAALSRVVDEYICSDCGMDEAMRDWRGLPPIPPDEWPIELDWGRDDHQEG